MDELSRGKASQIVVAVVAGTLVLDDETLEDGRGGGAGGEGGGRGGKGDMVERKEEELEGGGEGGMTRRKRLYCNLFGRRRRS
jgi:hypothetical protein